MYIHYFLQSFYPGMMIVGSNQNYFRVSAWTYRCVIVCPTTGQRVQSQPVTIEGKKIGFDIKKMLALLLSVLDIVKISSIIFILIVSTFARTPEKSLPSFKIALVICQEQYSSAKYFPPLMAPKLDGAALISALKQLDFQVRITFF